MNEHARHFNPLKIIVWGILGTLGVAALALVFGLVVMLLWNWLMPAIFGLPLIGYWQAWGLVLLSHILFKTGHHGSHGAHKPHYHDEKWKERFKKKFSDGGSEEENSTVD